MTAARLTAADVSSNNRPVDVKEYWDAGRRVLIVKATESTTYDWTAGAVDADLIHNLGGFAGWYEFARPGHSGNAQAQFFWKAISRHVKHHDLIAIDVEISGVTQEQVQDFIDEVKYLASRDGKRIRGLIYVSPSFAAEHGIHSYGGWKLWQAQYNSTAEKIPSWARWMLWQSTDHATVAGIPGTCDLSQLRAEIVQPDLRRGDRCFAVLDLKAALRAHGYRGLRLNAKFGIGAHAAVNRLKRKHHMRQDGIAGPKVWRVLGLR